APAPRAQRNLARVAAAALPGPRPGRDEPDPADARRPRLRQRIRPPHARAGAGRRPDRGALRARIPAPRLRPAAAAGLLPLHPAPAAGAAGRTVLSPEPSRLLHT